jgi:amino acid permease
VFLLIAVITATPYCFIPAKETYFQLIKTRGGTVSASLNRQVTFLFVTLSYALAVAIPDIKAAISIIGATANPFIGFVFPILFYLKLDPSPITSLSKIFAIFMLCFFIMTSFLALYVYFK